MLEPDVVWPGLVLAVPRPPEHLRANQVHILSATVGAQPEVHVPNTSTKCLSLCRRQPPLWKPPFDKWH